MIEARQRTGSQSSGRLISQLLSTWRDATGGANSGDGGQRPGGKSNSKNQLDVNQSSARPASEMDLAIVAHDISTPINVIAGAAWSLKEECSPEDRQFWIDCILRNVLSAQNRVEDLKDEVRDGHGLLDVPLTQMDLSKVVSEAVRDFVPLAQDNELRFYGDAAYILGDVERIKRLVFNLLCSAVSHSAAGREIKIDVWRRGTHVCLFVQDQGRGPQPNQNEQVFLPFKNLESVEAINTADDINSTEAGLASIKRIAAAHGATVKAQGTAGQGTIFEVSFKALAHCAETREGTD